MVTPTFSFKHPANTSKCKKPFSNRILLINDATDHENWGSIACAEALKQIILDANPEVEIKSIKYDWLRRKYQITKYPTAIKQKNSKKNILFGRFAKDFDFLPRIVDEFEATAREWLEGRGGPGAKEFIEQLNDVNLVVFNAEGSTYRNNYTATKAIFMLWLAKTKFQVPAFYLNGSVTLTTVDAILPAMIKKTFPILDGITIREPFSYRNLKEYMPDSKAELVPDSVFYYKSGDTQKATGLSSIYKMLDKKPYFCFSLSMLPMDYKRNPETSSLFHLITEIKKNGLQAVLMAKDRTDQFLSDLAQRTNSIFFGADKSYWDMFELLRNSRLLISGRYHHVMMASMGGCPSIPFTTTSHKMQGLCELLEGEIGQPYDATDLWTNMYAICQHAQKLLNHTTSKNEKLITITNALKLQTIRMGQIIQPALREAKL